MTAPDMRGRLRAIRERGGKVVVIDPRRTRTAEDADEHHFIRPGTDALLLFAIVNVLFDEGLVEPGTLAEHVNGLDEVRASSPSRSRPRPSPARPASPPARSAAWRASWPPPSAPPSTGGSAPARRSSARSRAGWSTSLNALTGNLDRAGGAMFTARRRRPDQLQRRAGHAAAASRPAAGRAACAGCPRRFGELPVAALAEEIETPGEGQVRALFTMAGNPAVSTPNAGRLDRALDSLELMVSIDVYVNETTRHADVILPGPSPLRRSHYDVALYQLAVRNVANYSPPVLEPDPRAFPTSGRRSCA